MGLKSFLKQQGFIAEEPGDKEKPENPAPAPAQRPVNNVAPTYFPLYPSNNTVGSSAPSAPDPSFVTPLQQTAVVTSGDQPDPTFIKFFEDELGKANIPGPDYFEFRQQLIKTQQKMAAKGIVAPEVVLQAVIMSFDAQEIPTAKLVETALHYKDVIKQKKEDFIKGAETEKNNQLQKRQTILQGHDDSIKKMQQQLQQLELQKKQLEDAMNKEKTQQDVDKTLGKEAIEKIEKAQRLISSAHDYMQSTIDTDIKRLQAL